MNMRAKPMATYNDLFSVPDNMVGENVAGDPH